jgi:hypothetical protein
LKEKINDGNEDSRDGFVGSACTDDDDEAKSPVSERSQTLSTPVCSISTDKRESRGSRKSKIPSSQVLRNVLNVKLIHYQF